MNQCRRGKLSLFDALERYGNGVGGGGEQYNINKREETDRQTENGR